MGNFVNKESWMGQQQLRYVEELLWWNGTLSRSEIIERFKCSPQQATAIIQSYKEMNPKAMEYSLKVRRYLANARMKCVFEQPSFIPEIKKATEMYSDVIHPLKKLPAKVTRNLIVSIRQNKSVKIIYQPTRNDEPEQRRIIPHAFGFDGVRYHVRAWCIARRSYRDFFLLRINSISWPDNVVKEDLPLDHYWNTWDEVRVKINPLASEIVQEDLMDDYKLETIDDPIVIKCRQAMKPYVLYRMGLDAYSTLPSIPFFEMA